MTIPDWLETENVKADASVIPKEQQLSNLAIMALDMRRLENEIEEAEATLKQLKADYDILAEGKVPELMQEIGVEKLTLSNGLKLSYKFFANGKVLDEKVYDWFENNGYSEIVKNNLTIKTRRIQKQDLQPVRNLIREYGLEFEEKDSIHYQTMGATLRELIDKGEKLPPADQLEVFRGFKATVK